MASSRIYEPLVKSVQIDGLVVMKMIKHCQEEGAGGAELVQGVLLGLVEGSRLEVTNCFPFPSRSDEEIDEVTYQMAMMRNLRQVNVDHLHVGWYQSTIFGSFINRALLESQYHYQNSIQESIVLIYDPLRTSKGNLALKALRLTPSMMALYRDSNFTPDSLRDNNMSFEKMFEELPIVIRNSNLVNVLLAELQEAAPSENKYQFLDLATSSVLEKNLRLLMDNVDELSQDANKYQRHCSKQQLQKQQAIARRQQENAAREARREPPLPEEDFMKSAQYQPPARLDALLLAGQIDSYVDQINQFSVQSFGKLFMADGLQSDLGPKTS